MKRLGWSNVSRQSGRCFSLMIVLEPTEVLVTVSVNVFDQDVLGVRYGPRMIMSSREFGSDSMVIGS
jgi:hypothetical protein